MSCELDTADLANEWTVPGTITAVPNLSSDQTVGVLAALSKSTNQAADVITEKGLGRYGLQLRDLQLTGIVKRCIRSDDDTITILNDASVFTGKDAVSNVNDLLGNEGLQQRIMIETITANMNTLTQEGVITGDESDEDTAAISGVAGKYTTEEVKSNFLSDLKDKFDGFLDPLMDGLGQLAALGALIAVVKNADILGKIKGIGEAVVSLPELASDTLDTLSLNLGVDGIIGSTKIPSAGDATKSAGAAIKGAASSALDTATSATSKAASTLGLKDIIDG